MTISDRRLLSIGNLKALSCKVDITSYANNGEDFSKTGLGIGGDPILVLASPTEHNLGHRWDEANKKFLLFYPLALHSHDLSLKNAAVADGATTRVNAGTNLLGANTGGDLTVAGAGANGGVQNKASAAGAQLTATDDGGTWKILAFYLG